MRRPRRPQRPAARPSALAALALSSVLLAGLAVPVGAQAQGPAYRAPVEAPKAPPPGDQAQPPQGQAQQGQAPAQAGPKFPNKDTAKNRKDYEMGTDSGGTILGRDAQTGETVILHVPPKKNQPGQDVEKPIEVKPVVPLIWK